MKARVLSAPALAWVLGGLSLVTAGGRGLAAETGAGRTLACFGPEPPAAFVAAAQRAGVTLVTEKSTPAPEPDVVCLVTPFAKDAAARQAAVTVATRCLNRGGLLLVAVLVAPEQTGDLAELLPLNPWSLSRENLRRPDAGLLAPADSPLAGFPGLESARLTSRFDLHLPYAAIEAGEHRYAWERCGKPLLNTDWQVLLTTNRDGCLPVLVSGRVGPGRVLVFGGDLFDAALVRWPGYEAFIGKLLETNAGKPAAAPALPAGLEISIPRHQAGPLQVSLRNTGQEPVNAVLVYKVRNAERAMLNSASQPVTIPASGSVTVPLVERSPALGALGITASADAALGFRHVEAGLTPVDRSAVLVRAAAWVDTQAPLAVLIEGEDNRACPELKNWPERGHGAGRDMAGGAPIQRYVYLCGDQPEVTVRVRNGLHNLAPLATAADLGTPENPTVQGLNDLAYSHGSLRDKWPIYGAWGGKSAPGQRLKLTWAAPVLTAGQTLVGQTSWRNWERSNPKQYSVVADNAESAPLVSVQDAAYVCGRRSDAWTPTVLSACTLNITGLDPAANQEPKPVSPSNCALTEWEVLGWPEKEPPPVVTGTLEVTATHLLEGRTEPLLREDVTVSGVGETVKQVRVPGRSAFGPVRLDAVLRVGGQVAARAQFDVLFVPPGRDAILPNKTISEAEMGLLCSPGFLVFGEFGLGTQADTQGWGGDDDKIWALTHDFMELGTRNADVATRLFTTSARFCHYTCPWRDFPSGEYFWDYATDQIEAMVTTGKWKGTKNLRVFLSDRWNGIPVNATFTWADFIRFDEYLRAKGGTGLEGRSRKQLIAEITSKYADQWQVWQMTRYADKLLETQRRLAEHGVAFSVTTHGSFPLAGGELGAKLGKTHKATGTDLFWELRNEDLYGSIGTRFGLIAANPDFESGAYNEWGWVSAVLNNPHWFAESGTVEPSRRQWYGTYFAGRVTSAGEFKPLTKYGFDAQGGFGAKNTINDWQQYYRTMQLATRVRPEAPSGFGLVVSWRLQERRMGARAGPLGFGLYAAEGLDQVDAMAGLVYQKLVKNGVPIGFVTSTHALKNWKGTNPLIVVDALSLEDQEIADLARLNAGGAPIIGIGGGGMPDGPEAEKLFTGEVGLPAGLLSHPKVTLDGIIHTVRRPGCAPVVYCPVDGKALTAEESARVAQAALTAAGEPITVSPGVAVTPFISNNLLFLALGDQGDVNREIRIALRPARLKTDLSGEAFRVVDVDRAVEIPARWEGGQLLLDLPTAAADGRLLLVCPR